MRITLMSSSFAVPYSSENYTLASSSIAAEVADRISNAGIDIIRFSISLDDPQLPANAAEKILRTDPDVIGMSCYVWDMEIFLKEIPKIRKMSPHVKIVAGGPSATHAAEYISTVENGPDVVVLGEGEQTFVEYLKTDLKHPEKVNNLIFKKHQHGRPYVTPFQSPLANLSLLKSPYLTGFQKPPQEEWLLETCRGCVYNCRGCYVLPYIGNRVRKRDPEVIRQEIRLAINYGCQMCFIIDSAFNADTCWMKNIADIIREEDPGRKMSYIYIIDYEKVSPEQIDILKNIPVHEILLNPFSLNPDAQLSQGQMPVDPCRVEEAISLLSKVGNVVAITRLGVPGDNLKGFIRTVEFLLSVAQKKNMRLLSINVIWKIVARGSWLDRNRARFGIRTPEKGVPYVLHSSSFSDSEMKDAFYYIYDHPLQSMLAWGDAHPSSYIKGIRRDEFVKWKKL
jgi:hypothetical protein